jgi:hypothetical protein
VREERVVERPFQLGATLRRVTSARPPKRIFHDGLFVGRRATCGRLHLSGDGRRVIACTFGQGIEPEVLFVSVVLSGGDGAGANPSGHVLVFGSQGAAFTSMGLSS